MHSINSNSNNGNNSNYLLYRKTIACNDIISNDYDNNEDNNHYVLNITNTCDNNNYITSLSNNTINCYDINTMNIIYSLNNIHNNSINIIETSCNNSNIYYSGSSDKTVNIYDSRVSSLSLLPISKIIYPDEIISLSIGMNDTLLAAGYNNTISFIDIRYISSNTSLSTIKYDKIKLGEYSDVHTDIITQLKFLKSNQSILVSAADDGLICTYNTSVSESESAILSILNTDCPIRKFGFFGNNNDEGLYCLSTIETLSIWHHSSALRIGNYNNIRNDLNIDYLVDCYYNNDDDTLKLISGKYNGDGIITKVEPNILTLESNLLSGHSAQIRCANVSSSSSSFNNIIATGGEDAKICTWVPSSVINDSNSSSSNNSGSSKSIHKPSKDRRSKPY